MAAEAEANPGILELRKDHPAQSLYFAGEETEAQSENYVIFDLEGIVEVIQSDFSTTSSYSLGNSSATCLIAGHPEDGTGELITSEENPFKYRTALINRNQLN